MTDIRAIADGADFIVDGYAFTKCDEGFRVINLNKTDSAALMSVTGDVLETSMDDIELKIVTGYLLRNLQFVEE